jgi:ABC-type Zn uptake system ZnuABC Zn-binding protein ZnuA
MLMGSLLLVHSEANGAQPLQVVASVPELGSLIEIIGKDEVNVRVLAKGTEDPHFVLPKPSYVTLLNHADLYAQMGLDLELGWAPALIRQARNTQIQRGGSGFFEAAPFIVPLQVPVGEVTRAMGDVHPYGSPHFLIDPLNGLHVANGIKKHLARLKQDKKKFFEDNFVSFRRALGVRLVGEKLFKKYDFEKLAQLQEVSQLKPFLEKQGDWDLLGGWWQMTLPHAPIRAVGDHQHWIYFARRFGVQMVGYMEPKPGITPSTRHLEDLVKRMKQDHVQLIFSSPYYDLRYGRFLEKNTGARVVELTHQAQGRPGTDDYLQFVDYNVKTLGHFLSKPLDGGAASVGN